MLYVYPIILIKGRLYHSTYSVGVVKSGGGRREEWLLTNAPAVLDSVNRTETAQVGKILKTNNNDDVVVVTSNYYTG